MADETRNLEPRPAHAPADPEPSDRPPVFLPAVDIHETDDGAVLLADLPGCDEASVDVRLEEGVLTITGRVEPDDFPGHQLTHGEYRPGDFERSFSVSDIVDAARIKARVKDGVLRLDLPKAEAAKPKKIQVKVT